MFVYQLMVVNSGLNYNWLNIQRMLLDTENGKLDLVINKDLFKLGRNYIIVVLGIIHLNFVDEFHLIALII